MDVALFYLRRPSARLSRARSLIPSLFTRSIGGKVQAVPHFEFASEPLGIPAESCYGFWQGGPGDSLGPNGRYLIHAKLGWGVGASVWLAKDNLQNSFVALKILSGYASQMNREEKLRELMCLNRLAELPLDLTSHCPKLLDHFYHRGIEQDGEHLCLVLRLEQTTLGAAWPTEGEGLPIPVVKRVLRHVLHGLSTIHSCGIAHADLKPDNIMVALSPQFDATALNDWISTHPPQLHPPTKSLHKTITRAYVSEQLPAPNTDELILCDFRVADLSHAQIVEEQTTDDIIPLTLRPPEVLLAGPWTEKVDIWTLGCLAFTLVTGKPLFNTTLPGIYTKFLQNGVKWTGSDDQVVENLIWQIAMFTGQRYPPLVLSLYPASSQYFVRNTGSLKSFKDYASRSLELIMQDAGFKGPEDDDLTASCAFIRRCLKLNPTGRPSAKDLLEDSWLQK